MDDDIQSVNFIITNKDDVLKYAAYRKKHQKLRRFNEGHSSCQQCFIQ